MEQNRYFSLQQSVIIRNIFSQRYDLSHIFAHTISNQAFQVFQVFNSRRHYNPKLLVSTTHKQNNEHISSNTMQWLAMLQEFCIGRINIIFTRYHKHYIPSIQKHTSQYQASKPNIKNTCQCQEYISISSIQALVKNSRQYKSHNHAKSTISSHSSKWIIQAKVILS